MEMIDGLWVMTGVKPDIDEDVNTVIDEQRERRMRSWPYSGTGDRDSKLS